MSKKKKVLFFLQAGVGGAERVTVTIGKSLDRNYFDVLFCLVDQGDRYSSIADFIPQDYAIRRIPKASPLRMMRNFFHILCREKPQVVFSSVMYLNTKLLPFRLLFPTTRFIIRCENYLYTFSRKQHLFICLTYRFADAIIAQTDEMKDELVFQMKIGGKKIKVLQNPIDRDSIDEKMRMGLNPYSDNGSLRFVASGRFVHQKGFDNLVRAFALARQKVDAELYIVGNTGGENNETYQKVMQIAHETGVVAHLHCVGFKENPYVYFAYADCYVLSSRWEGLPNVLIEALYLGTPVAAVTCIPVIGRIIREGVDGYLAEPKSVEALAEAMVKASALGRVKSTYQGAGFENFKKLFME